MAAEQSVETGSNVSFLSTVPVWERGIYICSVANGLSGCTNATAEVSICEGMCISHNINVTNLRDWMC